MSRAFNVKATVNYADDEADTPDFTVHSYAELKAWVEKLMVTETDATSYLITVVPVRS